MAQARKDEVREIVEEWKPEEHAEVRALIERFAQSMSSAPPVAA
jgi:hypothetical protein